MTSSLANLLACLALSADPAKPSAPLDVEPEDLRSGLLASYRSLVDKAASLSRVDSRPAFTLGHSSIHPRIPPGPFEARWTGVMLVKDTGPIHFEAYLCGEATMEVDGVTVLFGRGDRETSLVQGKAGLTRPAGLYRVTISYRSLPESPARLQLWWKGPEFAREPIPAWHFKHLVTDLPAAVKEVHLAESGRKAVEAHGCARCHGQAFPGVSAPPPGPSLADIGRRVKRDWLLDWLADPKKMRHGARMPALFADDRMGFLERWVIADMLVPGATTPASEPAGDHRMGRRRFVDLGCATCHMLPDADKTEKPDPERTSFVNLADRWPAAELAAFLANPAAHYPDGRMPRLPLTPPTARDIAAYLLMWSKAAPRGGAREGEAPAEPRTEGKRDAQTARQEPRPPGARPSANRNEPPTAQELHEFYRKRRLNGRDAALVLFRDRGCTQCHTGLGPVQPDQVPLAKADSGCLSGKAGPRFNIDAPTRKAITAYLAVARQERHPSPFESRQRLVAHLGCQKCHARDSERPPPIEAIGSTLGGAWLQEVPFQRTPRLYNPHQKYTRAYLLSAIREGVSGLRPGRYTYRMPAFGKDAEAVVQALAEADGDLHAGPEPAESKPADPTLGPNAGPSIAGFQGYSCVSCHIWNGRAFSEPDPGAVGTDLTRVAGRLRRDWFHRYLEGPARFNPSTVMPAIFPHGRPATLSRILDGDAARQQEALWSYFALGKAAPAPKPPPPMPIAGPKPGEPPLVAQIPVRLPDGKTVESICLLNDKHDLVVYDLQTRSVRAVFTGAQLLANVQGRLRWYTIAGTPAEFKPVLPVLFFSSAVRPPEFRGYERLVDGVSLHWLFQPGDVERAEVWRFVKHDSGRILRREKWIEGKIDRFLPRADPPPKFEQTVLPDTGKPDLPLDRPGYRVIAYPRPKTVSGEDRVMPSAIAVNPKDGRVFVASMKTGELFVVNDPTDDGKKARFDNYGHGLFQEAYSMLAEPDALYVLHRRNLTKITEKNGKPERFERVLALPHGVADTYDYAYGLAKDKTGAFVLSYAPYANTSLPGSGSALQWTPGKKPREVGFGFRNPVGWCAGPEGEVFFTDNQGEWVATNKLCHLSEGRFYGFPNSAQREHVKKPKGKTAVWVPYGWAKSINGVTYNHTGDRFGPFGGQIFMAELMFGGAIIRANVEKVNGEYQGACFPFWGPGLLGPLTLAFDPKGRLWVGGITEPGWMAQPDRGALFRIDFTGKTPFEMQSIHALPQGFRIVFTKPVSRKTALDSKAYRIEHYRYEHTGAYGSPELDRTLVPIERVELSADGRSVNVTTSPLVRDRVYMIQGPGVRSEAGESLVHPGGAYTLNEVPR